MCLSCTIPQILLHLQCMRLTETITSAPSCVESGSRFIGLIQACPFKQHLDWFSYFAQLTRVPNTERQTRTDHAMCNICSNKLHLCTECRGCSLIIISTLTLATTVLPTDGTMLRSRLFFTSMCNYTISRNNVIH